MMTNRQLCRHVIASDDAEESTMNAEIVARVEALAACPQDECGHPLRFFEGVSGFHFKCLGPAGHRWAPAPMMGDPSGEPAVLFLVGQAA
jgi:hypothetical protein